VSSRPGRRTSLLAVAAALLTTTGCASGFEATARQPYAPADGVQAASGDLRVLNALVVAAEDDSTGVVLMAVVNDGNESERLTGVESDAGTVELSGQSSLPAGETVVVGSGTDTTATIGGLTAEPGETITLRVSFDEAAPIELRTVVVLPEGYYADVTPDAEPTPNPTLSGTTEPTTSPNPISSPSSS
jgi:hypothetical protein